MFAAVALVGVGADAPVPTFGGWAALPALGLCFAAGLIPGARCGRAAYGLLAVAFATLLCAAELVFRLRGPIPSEAPGETAWHLLALYGGAVLAFAAGPGPLARITLWVAALAVVALTRAMLPSAAPAELRSDLVPLALSGVFAAVILAASGVSVWVSKRERVPPAHAAASYGRIRIAAQLFIVIAAAAGLASGAALRKAEARSTSDPSARASRMLHDSVTARLWPEAVLTGFGAPAARRIIDARRLPDKTPAPQWSGVRGFTAAYGTAGLMIAAILVCGLVRLGAREMEADSPPPAAGLAPAAGAAASAFLIGLWVSGMPDSSLILFLIAGWLGLTLNCASGRNASVQRAARTALPDRPQGFVRRSIAPLSCALSATIVFGAAGLLAGPAWTTRMVGSVTSPEALLDPELPRRIHRAMLFSPWSPAPHLLEAARLREELSRTAVGEDFDRTLFHRACEAYEAAIRLDPFSEVPYSRLGVILHAAGRTADAERMLAEGLERMPGSEGLADQRYYYLRDSGDAAAAAELTDQTLTLLPESEKWLSRLNPDD